MQILFYLTAGVLLLSVGANALVKGATGLARRMGISALVIGLTVVAFGTSSPEFAVSIKSALAGEADITVGNVVGSNIFNILFILGGSAVLRTLVIDRQLIRHDVPVMIAVSAVLLILSLDGRISRIEGLAFTAGLLLYLVAAAKLGRVSAVDRAANGDSSSLGLQLLLVLTGLAMLVTGADLLVRGAVSLARLAGLSELVIGLTVVAAGTSLPEVATSFAAARKGEHGIAVGNLIGSNIFNILGVLGLSALLAPEAITVSASALNFDIPIMFAVAILCWPVLHSGNRVTRLEGLALVAGYVFYTAWLVFIRAVL